jgi:hypothetical protein
MSRDSLHDRPPKQANAPVRPLTGLIICLLEIVDELEAVAPRIRQSIAPADDRPGPPDYPDASLSDDSP